MSSSRSFCFVKLLSYLLPGFLWKLSLDETEVNSICIHKLKWGRIYIVEYFILFQCPLMVELILVDLRLLNSEPFWVGLGAQRETVFSIVVFPRSDLVYDVYKSLWHYSYNYKPQYYWTTALLFIIYLYPSSYRYSIISTLLFWLPNILCPTYHPSNQVYII